MGNVSVVFRPLTQWPVGRVRTPEWQREEAKFKRSGSYVGEEASRQWVAGKPMPVEVTYTELDRELNAINAVDVVVQIDVRDGARHIRSDESRPLADARVQSPAIVLSFKRDGNRLAFACDRFTRWQDNLRGIVLGLESLRRLERYGIVQSGEQYRGWLALPSATGPAMDSHSAAEAIAIQANGFATPLSILGDVGIAKSAVRAAIHRTHPDRNNGARAQYDRVDAARKVLSSHHGVSL